MWGGDHLSVDGSLQKWDRQSAKSDWAIVVYHRGGVRGEGVSKGHSRGKLAFSSKPPLMDLAGSMPLFASVRDWI